MCYSNIKYENALYFLDSRFLIKSNKKIDTNVWFKIDLKNLELKIHIDKNEINITNNIL